MFENPGIHISRIITETNCPKHMAIPGMPCWTIFSNIADAGYYRAVCGKRIKRAGFIGSISPQSMRLKSEHQKRSAPRKFSKRSDDN